MKSWRDQLKNLLLEIYRCDKADRAFELLSACVERHLNDGAPKKEMNENDVVLITYGDIVHTENEKPLETLRRFLKAHFDREITNVHLLPIYPYTSDDGFSVADYLQVSPELGDWDDVERLAGERGIMLDAVINHSSKSHEWFQKCLKGEKPYADFYIECDPNTDTSVVFRPRVSPLLTAFETNQGVKHYWTTFSDDQLDLNYQSPELLCEIAEVLLDYARHGARLIRLDAIGFAWKELGTRCMSQPQVHALIRMLRVAVEAAYPGVKIITETNVPHLENISYFGTGDEAHLVYQFPLPPLTLYSVLTQSAAHLTEWAQSLEKTPLPVGTTYFNFLASHDGIGVQPVKGILNDEEQQVLLKATLEHGGRISSKAMPDGSTVPYELNINYMDALTPPDADDDLRLKRFMVAQAIMLSMQGVPGIYYHSLLGSRNWEQGVWESGINRRINREKFSLERIESELKDPNGLRCRTMHAYQALINCRSACSAFSPYASQKVQRIDDRVFALERMNSETGCRVWVRINLSGEMVILNEKLQGKDLLSGENNPVELQPYQIRWIEANER